MSIKDKTYLVTAPAVVLGEGSGATYLYRGGIVPAGFATEEQIKHHLAIKAIEELDLPEAEDADETLVEGAGGTDDDGKPTDLLDGKSFDDWRLDDLKADAKEHDVKVEGTSKDAYFRALVAQRAAQ